jgi:hypothetical protein
MPDGRAPGGFCIACPRLCASGPASFRAFDLHQLAGPGSALANSSMVPVCAGLQMAQA